MPAIRVLFRLVSVALKLLVAAAVAVPAVLAMADIHPHARSARPADPLLLHVHGLAYSADGRDLLVPNHTGLARFRDGGWSEVAGPIHDFAGFSLTERAIYASGHPAPGSDLPNPLGLVKSIDGGASWTTLALGGEADFHILAAGYRSNSIYVLNVEPNSAMSRVGLHHSTDDGKTWRYRAGRGVQGNGFALAAHPIDPATVAVVTDKGLFLSRDAGESFKRFDGRLAATAVTFELDGQKLRFARAIRRQMVSAALDSRSRTIVLLPPIGLDYVTHIAQSPTSPRTFAIATDRRHVYVTTSNAGRTWRQIAKDGDLP